MQRVLELVFVFSEASSLTHCLGQAWRQALQDPALWRTLSLADHQKAQDSLNLVKHCALYRQYLQVWPLSKASPNADWSSCTLQHLNLSQIVRQMLVNGMQELCLQYAVGVRDEHLKQFHGSPLESLNLNVCQEYGLLSCILMIRICLPAEHRA